MDTPVAPLKFGLVGAGAIAQTYAQAFRVSKHVQLVGVADVRAEAAQALSASLGCPGFDDYRRMAEEVGCQGVVVCTPPSTHPEICTWFLDRGIHVLCEKPLSIDVASARKMFAAAADGGATLTMASKFRYVADVARARSLVASGLIGEVVLFENCFTSRVDMSKRWNAQPDISGGGVLIDNGTHSLDIVRYFLGPLVHLQVVEGKRTHDLPVEETVRVFAQSAGGVMANIDLSWSIHKEQSSYINIFGSDGTLSVGWKESKYRRMGDADWTVFGNGYDKVQAFTAQLDNFALAIRGQQPLVITPEDALASVQAMEAAYAALRRSRWTAIRAPRELPRPRQRRRSNVA